MSGTPAVQVLDPGTYCFACLKSPPNFKTTHAKRAKCVERQAHRPIGPVLVHHDRAVKVCSTCGTLVSAARD